ncbi:FxSxx-COOH system tetratricopeptide repeat protein [Nocardia sp. NPDC055053]
MSGRLRRFLRSAAWPAVSGAGAFTATAAGWASTAGIGWIQLSSAGAAALLTAGVTHAELRMRTTVAPAPTRTEQLTQSPPRNPVFTGRDAELAEIERLLAGPTPLPVVLCGIGGVGKTQLAIEYAHRFADRYTLIWWVDAENSDLVAGHLAALSVRAEVVALGTETSVAAHLAIARLRSQASLIVFDNVEEPAAIRAWLPGPPVHVMITSRRGRWNELAVPVTLDVLSRPDSAALLRRQCPSLSQGDAERLGQALGYLPLGLAQAAGTLSETRMSASEYLSVLDARAVSLLDGEAPAGYGRSLGAATRLSAGRLAAADSAAGRLLSMCALIAPEPVPRSLLVTIVAAPRPDEENIAPQRDMWWQLTASIGRFGLARIDESGLQLHRLTQTILRAMITDTQRMELSEQICAALSAAHPGDPSDATTWARWAALLPHLLAAEADNSTDERLADMLCDTAWYLAARGDCEPSLHLALRLHERWRQVHHPDHPFVLRVANSLAFAYRGLGDFEAAHELDADVYSRRCRLNGRDHPDTLAAGHNLAIDLHARGSLIAARDLNEEIWRIRRRVQGPEHPDTLAAANNLAFDLLACGDPERAISLDDETLEIRRRVLGLRDHCTLTSANNLAVSYRATMNLSSARRLHEETLAERCDILGREHPHSMTSSNNMGVCLRASGEVEESVAIHEDLLTRRRQLLGDKHHDTLTTANNLAVALHYSEDRDRATALLRDTLDKRRSSQGDRHPDTLIAASNLAMASRPAGQ